MAALFAEGFAELKAKHPALLLESRQRGLMMGIKLADEQLGPLLSLAGLHHGLLTVYANNDTSVNQILPPLIISETEARQVLASLDAMLGWVGEMVGMRGGRWECHQLPGRREFMCHCDPIFDEAIPNFADRGLL